MVNLKGRDLVSLSDYTSEEIDFIWSQSLDLKRRHKSGEPHELLRGKSIAIIFETPSTRTRISFEAAMTQLGGHALYIDPNTTWMGTEETVGDAVGVMNRYVDGIAARLLYHSKLEEMARHVNIPVINASTNYEHPCQALADFLTVKEKKGNLKGLKYVLTWAWRHVGPPIGLVHSTLFVAPKMGTDLVIACPKGYEPDETAITKAKEDAEGSGGSVEIINDMNEAVEGADAINIYSWVSPKAFAESAKEGFRAEAPHLKEPEKYKHWIVSDEVVNRSKKDSLVMHCMPAARGEEVTNEVLDGPRSIIFDEAENRIHVQKGILSLLIGR